MSTKLISQKLCDKCLTVIGEEADGGEDDLSVVTVRVTQHRVSFQIAPPDGRPCDICRACAELIYTAGLAGLFGKKVSLNVLEQVEKHVWPELQERGRMAERLGNVDAILRELGSIDAGAGKHTKAITLVASARAVLVDVCAVLEGRKNG